MCWEINNHTVPYKYETFALIILGLVIFTTFMLALGIGSKLDNKALIKNISAEKLIFVTHRGKKEIIDAKIKYGALIPHGVVAKGRFQELLGEYILKKIDGKEKVTWVSLGKPMDSKEWQLGMVRNNNWDKAIVVCVAPDKIHIPNSFFKRIFGRHQLVLKEKIVLSGMEEVHIKVNSQWIQL